MSENQPTMPDESKVASALNFLALTDEEHAGLKAAKTASEYMLKHHKAQAMLSSDEKSMAGKEAQAYASQAYANAVEDLRETIVELETVAAKRKRAELTIDVWRSLNANRRQG